MLEMSQLDQSVQELERKVGCSPQQSLNEDMLEMHQLVQSSSELERKAGCSPPRNLVVDV